MKQHVTARALYDFESGGGGELSFTADEILSILRQDIGDGWWEARNASGQTGLIPEAYVEVTSMPEPSIPPPPPPTYLQNPAAPPKPSAPPSSWQPPAASPPKPTWSPPSAPPVNNTHPGANLRGQDSYEDWDDEWDDDDDSSTTTETPSEFAAGGGYGLSRETSKFGTVRKGLTSKQGGDAYLFGPAVNNVPESEKITIIDTVEGPFWQSVDNPYSCEITSPKKESKYHGMKSYIAYQITPSFSNIVVSRRYKHFDWLHERLVAKYSAIVIPPLPDKQISGRYEDDFISERMRQLQGWVDRMCQHPVITHADVFHHFLSCTDDKRWKGGKRKAEKDEFLGGKFFLTVTAPAAPIEQKEIENKIDRFSRFVKSMDDSVRHLYNIGDNNAKKHMGPFKKEFQKLGHGFMSLARSFEFDERESAQQLTRAVEHTGRTYEDVGKLFEQQPRHDMGPLLEALHEYKGMLAVFPDCLSVHKAASQKMEENYCKLTESEATTAQSRVDVISYATLAEMNHFDQYRVVDFKRHMQNYLKQQIEFYTKITGMLQENLQQYDDA